MDIEKYCIVTLEDDKEYVVVSKINYDSNDYVYLVGVEDNKNIKICKEEKGISSVKLIDVDNKELFNNIVPLFYNDVKEIAELLTSINS